MLSEALCWDGKALRHDDEKETANGTSKQPMEREKDWTKNRMNAMG